MSMVPNKTVEALAPKKSLMNKFGEGAMKGIRESSSASPVPSEESDSELMGHLGIEDMKNISSMHMKLLGIDSGFYGHNKVPGGKSDGSGFYKHQKEVGQTLF